MDDIFILSKVTLSFPRVCLSEGAMNEAESVTTHNSINSIAGYNSPLSLILLLAVKHGIFFLHWK